MMLMTQENRHQLPALGSQDGKGDEAIAYVKLFHPLSRYTFYVTEFDGDDTLFGWCVSPLEPNYDEWGYASLNELQTTVAKGLPMERDRYFTPSPVRECKAKGL